jgi:hypothetical protein
LSDQLLQRNTGVQTFDTSVDFSVLNDPTLSSVSWALTVNPDPTNITIDSDGVISFDTNSTGLLSTSSIVVEAANSAGSDTSGFSLTVADVPDAFADGDWSMDGAGDVTITALPSDNNDPLTDIEYRINGGAAQSFGATTTGTYATTAGSGDNVEIRAVNSIGAGAWSDVKVAENPPFLAPSVVSAHSVARAIDSVYTGNLIRVRRSSDNAEADIGQDGSGNLDETALLSHTGSGTGDHGYIVKIYEQSGDANAVDLGQTTASLQPEIVKDGVVHKAKSKPTALQPSPSPDHEYVEFSSWNTRPSDATAFVVGSFSDTGSRRDSAMALSGSNSVNSGIVNSNTSTAISSDSGTPSYYNNNTFVGTQGDGTTMQDMLDSFGNAGLLIMRHENVDMSNADWAGLRTEQADNLYEGHYEFSEFVICDSPSSTDISDIESDQATFYGITLA